MKTIFKILIIILVIAVIAATIYAVINADFSGLTEKISSAFDTATEWIYEKISNLVN